MHLRYVIEFPREEEVDMTDTTKRRPLPPKLEAEVAFAKEHRAGFFRKVRTALELPGALRDSLHEELKAAGERAAAAQKSSGEE